MSSNNKISLEQEIIKFASPEEYYQFLKDLCSDYIKDWNKSQINKNTIFGCIEQVESFFGVSFSNPNDENDDEIYPDKMTIPHPELTPESYPCLFLTYSVNGLTYMGDKSRAVPYRDEPHFIYKADFK